MYVWETYPHFIRTILVMAPNSPIRKVLSELVVTLNPDEKTRNPLDCPFIDILDICVEFGMFFCPFNLVHKMVREKENELERTEWLKISETCESFRLIRNIIKFPTHSSWWS